ncbi:60S ribosomal protein L24 [Ceratobasidium sp. 428]|nr:60S ribosomal protein L24 [Ceratobasidium sp. 428]
MKVEIDSFSGYKIYPSKGKLYVRGDSKVFRFSTSKSSSLFLQRKNPRKIAWTVVYRRMHKKASRITGIAEETVKKRSRKTVKHQRGIVGADLAAIAAKRNQSAADRTTARNAAIAKAKQEKKSKEDAKTKAKAPAARAPTGAPKAPKQAKGGKGR